jgi:hypothetical protein
MRGPGVRDEHVVRAQLLDAIGRRDHAASELNFEAYLHLSEQVYALIEELAALTVPAPRPPAD